MGAISHFLWNNMGDVYKSLKEYIEAIKCYEKAGELNPDSFVGQDKIEELKKKIK